MAESDVIYSDDMITVTRSLITTRSDSYPVESITKVAIYKPDTSKQDTMACVLIALAFFGMFILNSRIAFGSFFILAFAVGIFGRLQPHVLGVSSRISGREHLLFELRDRIYLERIMSAIEQARVRNVT
jgi:hypothetical protein